MVSGDKHFLINNVENDGSFLHGRSFLRGQNFLCGQSLKEI